MTRPAGHRAATSTFTPPSPKTHLSDDYPIGSINHYRSIHPTIDHSTNTAAMGSKRRRGEPKEVWPTFAVSLAHRDWQELFYYTKCKQNPNASSQTPRWQCCGFFLFQFSCNREAVPFAVTLNSYVDDWYDCRW